MIKKISLVNSSGEIFRIEDDGEGKGIWLITDDNDEQGTYFNVADIEQWEEIKKEIEQFFPPRVYGGRELTLSEKKVV